MLPRQRAWRSTSSADGEKRAGRRLFSRLNCATKCCTSAGMSSSRSRSGGTEIGITLRRKYRSSRNRPSAISSSRSLFVAAITRTSTLIVRDDPSRSTSPSWSTRSTLACVLALMSPTSSRKIVPAVGHLELADLLFGRAGERAALVAEELGLDQLFRNGRAVDLHEPLFGAQAVAMDRARDELLADAALAEDQHRRVGRRRAADLVHDLFERGALADDLMPRLERRSQRAVLAPERPELQAFAHGVEDVVLRQRLLDEPKRAEPAGFERGRRRAVRRDHHDRQAPRSSRAGGSAPRARRGRAS